MKVIGFSKSVWVLGMERLLRDKSSGRVGWLSPLIEQLRSGGRLIAPVLEGDTQNLTLLEKGSLGIQRQVVCEVLYVSLRGIYGS